MADWRAGDGNPRFSGARADGRGEHPLQRADRNMIELLQELRVAQTGVQILFAFLLTLSFTERFGSVNEVQRWTYVVTLLLSVLTAGLFVAPAAVHRITFRRGLKAETVQLGHRLFSLGLGALALTLTGAVLLVLDVAVGLPFAITAASAVVVVLCVLWFVLPIPMLRRARPAPLAQPNDGDGEPGDDRAGGERDEGPPPDGRAAAPGAPFSSA
ncbi:MAG TPA: DUF6328 family protein [Pseudonocardia sp.]|jgi:hypothetical protein|uniref:DUF6328 family protein n=1 Tax=Pseudonocardia sp. TaxID=60912 RepID=UPI002B4AE9A0|nr:DUF6328 family protein [Pseudonocardia sp.]HLU57892.1 DUF6328 family protein [Pseudonocardia sp.]